MDHSSDRRDVLAVARSAAAAAAEVHREGRGRIGPSGWNEKGRSDFVTEVDLEAERQVVETIRSAFPDDEVLAEEGTAGLARPLSPSESSSFRPIRWIIDPLDGTTNWLHGYPEYAVSIAAEDERGLLAGLVLNSATGERFEAMRGGGATLDGIPIRVSEVADLNHALVGTGFPFKKTEMLPAYLTTFERVLRGTSGIRRAGAAALDLCDLACGRLDAFFEFWLMPWDVAAGALIVREAGGVFERLPCGDLDPAPSGSSDLSTAGIQAGGFLAANERLAGEFRTLVKAAG